MHLVAVTRWAGVLEAELPTLAASLGLTVYDCRLRAAAGLPVLLCTEHEAAIAAQRVEALRARGHGALSCSLDAVPKPSENVVVRDFELLGDGLRCVDDGGRTHEVTFGDLMAMVRASSISGAEQTTTTVERKLNLGRALLTSGLMLTKATKVETRASSEAREQVLYVYCRSRVAPLVFRELGLRYQGLGAQLKSTTLQNFVTLVEHLRSKAPHALYDQRFLQQKRKQQVSLFSGSEGARRVETSNEQGNELGAFLLMLGHLEQQL